ncbi:LuxR family transcriptional regulator [Mycobacterium sp. PS03-16]|uniref:helix-turn-helix transcriptional regulator n=1 Tax=Mycobacterium sp. PS03-16 TaxID=2559611 RepID=UPI001074206F|nr:LuxR C-terminal-related transcriptional regulator [Mycobacterium sp. PS03-16]TFV59218.1 LuxR family transcriptional regulator [Mycobacterium sp. PS03-16]
MVTLGEFSRLVSAIHAAAVTPEHWFGAMSAVRESLGAITGAMLIDDGTGRVAERRSLEPVAYQAYTEYYYRIDYVLDAVESSPVGMIHDGRALIDAQARSEFYTDWIRPHHMDDGLFVRVTGSARPACLIVANPRGDEPFLTAERAQLVNALVPHFQQALRTEKYLHELRCNLRDTAEAIDYMRRAVVVVGPNASVVQCNSSAEAVLERSDGLTVRAGRLRACSPAADAELQRAVSAALGLSEGGARSGSSLLCPKPGGRPYVVHSFPFPGDGGIDGDRVRALLVILDPDAAAEPPKSLLRRLFGLTNAESDVALRVGRGDGLTPISEDLTLSLSTVKTHLQHVFDKTDTHRQAELVRLLTTLQP